MPFFVYIMTNRKNGTLYIGMTDHLSRRVWEHRTGVAEGIHSQTWFKDSRYYELHESRESAFIRERQMKKWNRAWKLQLIEGMNSSWRDLSADLV